MMDACPDLGPLAAEGREGDIPTWGKGDIPTWG